MISIRASSLPRILKCTHSLRLPKHDVSSKYASAGNNIHKEVAQQLLTKTVSEHSYVQYINSLSIVKRHVEESLSYTYYNRFELTGTPDFWGIDNAQILHIVDLKTGYQDVWPNSAQLMAYALLVLSNNRQAKIKSVKLTIFQHSEAFTLSLSKKSIFRLKTEIIDALNSHRFQSGDHCQYCPSKQHCLIMSDALHSNNLFELESKRSILKKMIEDNHSYLLTNYPDKFVKKGRTFILKNT